MTKIKICGIKELEHAMCAVDAGADYLGFVFAKSKRQITVTKAKEIIDRLPKHIKTVGVFVDEPLSNMVEIANTCGLDILQLHGSETYDLYKDSSYPVIKSVSVKTSGINTELGLPKADYLLFDTWHKDMAGGCGNPFNWDYLKNHTFDSPYFLAGGLNKDNVATAIRQLKPFAVDVSSGVETNNRKDNDKIISFIKCVKECQQ